MMAASAWTSLFSEASNLVNDASLTEVASKASTVLTGALVHNWGKVALASIVPMTRPLWNHYSKTVIRVRDDEQVLWLRLWLLEQKESLKHIRDLQLPPKGNGLTAKRNRDMYESGSYCSYDDDDEEEEEEVHMRKSRAIEREKEGPGMPRPRKFKFEPAATVTIRTRVGFWPVFIKQEATSYSGYSSGYTVTVWFAPNAKDIVSNILIEGQRLWLNKQTAKTEIIEGSGYSGLNRMLRPSRPLTSVIVEACD